LEEEELAYKCRSEVALELQQRSAEWIEVALRFGIVTEAVTETEVELEIDVGAEKC
jgi:hypothetical protein